MAKWRTRTLTDLPGFLRQGGGGGFGTWTGARGHFSSTPDLEKPYVRPDYLRSGLDGRTRLSSRHANHRRAVVNLVANGTSGEEILRENPDLEREDVRQSLKYASELANEKIGFFKSPAA